MTEEQIEKEAERYAGNLVDELDKNHSLFTVARSDLFNHHYHDWKAGYHFRDKEVEELKAGQEQLALDLTRALDEVEELKDELRRLKRRYNVTPSDGLGGMR